MKSELNSTFNLVIVLLLAASPMFAHHGGGIYDREHPVTVTGTVTAFEFTNPHVRIHFDVKEDNGTVTNWIAETAPPQKMFRAGWNRDSLKPGDTIIVTGFPSRDGKKVMSVRKLKPPNGVDLSEGAE